jgi:Putative metal-binding motif
MTLTMRVQKLSLAALVAMASACAEEEHAADDEPVATETAALSAGCTALGQTITNHSCQHGQLGPFGSVTASSNPNFTTTTPRFDVIHKYFSVTLPGSSGSYAGTVKFTPATSDDHAIYVHPSVTLSVRNKNGVAVSPLITGNVSGCAYLTSYKVYFLSTALAPYKIDLAATTNAVKMLLESVTPQAERWYQDNDGDTFGATSPSFVTACVPPAGYNVKKGGDCNNANASVYPGAPEIAGDGIDSNCNGNDNT